MCVSDAAGAGAYSDEALDSEAVPATSSGSLDPPICATCRAPGHLRLVCTGLEWHGRADGGTESGGAHFPLVATQAEPRSL
jgi:hypothetical protein